MVARLFLETGAVVVVGTLIATIIGRIVQGKCKDESSETRLDIEELDLDE